MKRLWSGCAAMLCVLGVGQFVQAQPVSVSVVQGDYYVRQLVVFSGTAGDVTFDPQDGGRIYITRDDGAASGGGIYSLDEINGVLMRSERVAPFSNPSGIVFTADGDLWITSDFGPRLDVVRAPRNGAPYTVEQLISGYLSSADDDPVAIGLAPAGFDGPFVDPGDLVIADRGLEDNAFNFFAVYTPNSIPGDPGSPTDPTAYATFLAEVFTLGAYDNNDLNDFAFSASGASIFAVFEQGQVVEVSNAGNVVREVPVSGVTFSSLKAVAVNPLDGRIWVADDDLDAVWSINPATGAAIQELQFAKVGQVVPDTMDVHDPSMRFTADGQTLVVSDQGSPGYVWVFDLIDGANNPPQAVITTDPVDGRVPLIDGAGVLTLDGSASTDGDSGVQGLTYQWTLVSGIDGTIDSPNSAITTATLREGGDYVFALMVDDGQAMDNTAVAQVWINVPGPGVQLYTDTFKCGRFFPFPTAPGEAAFDPTDNNTIYVANDTSLASNGGVYRFDTTTTNGFEIGEQIVAADGPSGMTFTADGDLWFVRDGSAGNGAHMIRITAPRLGAPYTATDVIAQFQTTGDDDSFAIVVAPAGFDGPNVDPGDLLIVDRGADSNPPNAIYRYNPTSPVGNPAAYAEFFMTTGDFGDYLNNDANGVGFSPDGTKMYLALSDLILEIDAQGTILREIPITGVTFTNIDGFGVNPVDGRLWVGDDTLDEVWSLDPITGVAQRELRFVRGEEIRPDFNINIHDPTINFTADGTRMLISEIDKGGGVWVFDTQRAIGPDFDCDGDVDLTDYIFMNSCFSGPDASPASIPCANADVDGDGDVDLVDFAIFQMCFSGDAPADPACDD